MGLFLRGDIYHVEPTHLLQEFQTPPRTAPALPGLPFTASTSTQLAQLGTDTHQGTARSLGTCSVWAVWDLEIFDWWLPDAYLAW